LIHHANDGGELRARLEALGVTHVVVNLNSMAKYRTVFVDHYTKEDFEEDLAKLVSLLQNHSTLVLSHRGVLVRRHTTSFPDGHVQIGSGERPD
jgi:hypothetical protein